MLTWLESLIPITNNSLGGDFWIMWHAGRNLLLGLSPYDIQHSWYPPASNLLFALFATLPLVLSYVIWVVINLGFLVYIKRKEAPGWLLFVPAIFMFAFGQIDLLFVLLMLFLPRKDWKSVAAAAIITLKPQIALVVLPWWLIKWLLKDRTRLLQFVGAAAALHLAPLFIRPQIYFEFFEAVMGAPSMKFGGVGPILFYVYGNGNIFMNFAGNIIIIWLVILIAVYCLDEKVIRVILSLLNPYLAYYDLVILMDTAPWYVLGPLSIGALALTHILNSWIPMILIPAGALFWQTWILIPEKETAALEAKSHE
jgi:hypothetical protein